MVGETIRNEPKKTSFNVETGLKTQFQQHARIDLNTVYNPRQHINEPEEKKPEGTVAQRLFPKEVIEGFKVKGIEGLKNQHVDPNKATSGQIDKKQEHQGNLEQQVEKAEANIQNAAKVASEMAHEAVNEAYQQFKDDPDFDFGEFMNELASLPPPSASQTVGSDMAIGDAARQLSPNQQAAYVVQAKLQEATSLEAQKHRMRVMQNETGQQNDNPVYLREDAFANISGQELLEQVLPADGYENWPEWEDLQDQKEAVQEYGYNLKEAEENENDFSNKERLTAALEAGEDKAEQYVLENPDEDPTIYGEPLNESTFHFTEATLTAPVTCKMIPMNANANLSNELIDLAPSILPGVERTAHTARLEQNYSLRA